MQLEPPVHLFLREKACKECLNYVNNVSNSRDVVMIQDAITHLKIAFITKYFKLCSLTKTDTMRLLIIHVKMNLLHILSKKISFFVHLKVFQ